MGELCAGLTLAHNALSQLDEYRRVLVNQDTLPNGLFVLPNWLPHPRDRATDMAEFFKTAKKEGFCSSIPKELS
jgi:hypothetical protein